MVGKRKGRNRYANFVDDYCKRMGIAREDGFRVCGDLWSRLTEEEKNRFKTARNTGCVLDSLGNPVTSAEEQSRAQLEQAFRVKEYVAGRLDQNVGYFGADIGQEFILVHVNMFCKTAQGQVVPAEIGAVKFTIADGARELFHEILRPESIPLGNRMIFDVNK